MNKNYTEEVTTRMIEEYQQNPTIETVRKLAEKLEKPVKSVIGKLSREGVYVKQVYTTKTGDPVVTKKELVADIAVHLDFEPEELEGLEKTPKLVLQKIARKLG